jgi:nucleotide-binding universal stress UspA family protein
MSTLRSILLHLDASPRSAARLLLTRELAARHDARVTALYAMAPSAFSVPFAMAEGAVEAFSIFQQLDRDRRDDARALFDQSITGAAMPMHWREQSEAALIPGVVQRALCADLLVLGQHDASDPLTVGVPTDFVASVLIASGRPALVIPYAGEWATIGGEVLIAWKPTRESAHAVSSAIPLLRRAGRVHLAAEVDRDTPGASVADLEDYLRLHGVRAPIERHAAVPSAEPGEGLLSLAADAGADLLVMGCYGHGRARELILGGATRTVLKSMTLPALMAH